MSSPPLLYLDTFLPPLTPTTIPTTHPSFYRHSSDTTVGHVDHSEKGRAEQSTLRGSDQQAADGACQGEVWRTFHVHCAVFSHDCQRWDDDALSSQHTIQIRTDQNKTHVHSRHSTKHTLTTQHITSHHRIEHTYTHHTPQNRTNTFLSSFLFILHPLVHYSTPTHSSHPLSDIVFSPGLPCLPLGCDESGGNCSLDIGDNDLRKTGTYSAFIKVSSMS